MALIAPEVESRFGALASTHSFAEDARWQLARRVAGSPAFQRAPLLAQFLMFICERKLAGQERGLTEQAIGEEVFRRRPGYSTGEDNIVRSYAHRLRARLREHFETDGRGESVEITIPRGAYVPDFLPRRSATSLPEPALSAAPPTSLMDVTENVRAATDVHGVPDRAGRSVWVGMCVLFALVLCAAGAVAWKRRNASAAVSPEHILWAQIFNPEMRTLVVTTDNGLGVLQDLSGRPATLKGYIDGTYFAQFSKDDTAEHRKMQRLSRERLTSVPDSAAAAAMLLLPEARRLNVALRNARALQMSDLKQANLILLGSTYGDPWVSLFESQMNFKMNYYATPDTYASEIINSHPRPGEQPFYRNSSTAAPYTTYAVVALLPNLDGTGWVLIVEGLTMAGTEAAVDFLMHNSIDPLLREATGSSGHLRPFEAMLRTASIDSASSASTLLLTRVY